MSKLKLVFAVLAVVGVACLWELEHLSNERLRRENESLRLSFAELKQSQDGREPVSADNSLTKEQLAELLKLRGEVTQLRGQTNEMISLRGQNEKLLTSLKDALKNVKPVQTNATAKKRPEDALPQDIHPRNSWTFRGYDSPDATAESLCWAMAHGDKAAFVAGFSPDTAAQMENDMKGKDFAEEMNSADMGEFRILDRQPVSDDEVVLTVYSTRKDANGDYAGSSEDTVFKKIGGEWKISDSAPPK
ncbi:MAG TPA: nuclear transport factor 2 family protein [Verrucomicrobiae bacterium]|jgi:hypothetical protein